MIVMALSICAAVPRDGLSTLIDTSDHKPITASQTIRRSRSPRQNPID